MCCADDCSHVKLSALISCDECFSWVLSCNYSGNERAGETSQSWLLKHYVPPNRVDFCFMLSETNKIRWLIVVRLVLGGFTEMMVLLCLQNIIKLKCMAAVSLLSDSEGTLEVEYIVYKWILAWMLLQTVLMPLLVLLYVCLVVVAFLMFLNTVEVIKQERNCSRLVGGAALPLLDLCA